LTILLGYVTLGSKDPAFLEENSTVRLTTKGRYAVTAMLDLAFHSEKSLSL